MKKVKFLDIELGGLFMKDDCLWVRTSYQYAKSKKYGCCNFTKDKEDEYVDPIDIIEVEKLIKEKLNNE